MRNVHGKEANRTAKAKKKKTTHKKGGGNKNKMP